jgi:UDP-N-acetylglucosamine 2-epimerase (non-hydrolysing)
MRVPEEINRRIVDHTADVNLTYSSIARDYLLREGLSPDLVIKTGSPMYEVLSYYRDGIGCSDILDTLGLSEGRFTLASIHREENIDSKKNFYNLIETLNTVASYFNEPLIISTHPRTQKRIDEVGVEFHKNVRLLKPLGFKDYNKLQITSRVVLSDSGTITEESSILNFPALNIREAHERPEGMEEASVMMVGVEKARVMQGMQILENQTRGVDRNLSLVAEYAVPNVSEKIVRIIHSYRDYVMRTVWKEY